MHNGQNKLYYREADFACTCLHSSAKHQHKNLMINKHIKETILFTVHLLVLNIFHTLPSDTKMAGVIICNTFTGMTNMSADYHEKIGDNFFSHITIITIYGWCNHDQSN